MPQYFLYCLSAPFLWFFGLNFFLCVQIATHHWLPACLSLSTLLGRSASWELGAGQCSRDLVYSGEDVCGHRLVGSNVDYKTFLLLFRPTGRGTPGGWEYLLLREAWGLCRGQAQECWCLKLAGGSGEDGDRFPSQPSLARLGMENGHGSRACLLGIEAGQQSNKVWIQQTPGNLPCSLPFTKTASQSLLTKVPVPDPIFIPCHSSLCILFASDFELFMVPGVTWLCHTAVALHVMTFVLTSSRIR